MIICFLSWRVFTFMTGTDLSSRVSEMRVSGRLGVSEFDEAGSVYFVNVVCESHENAKQML